ncbi:hypothetical protein M0R45_029312 [Rubus argutus]|uniref:Uncharacterized protein n=1 Tax=Rubus argutus TaxID=59490 RepID=A0AAW1WA69_RUBAR
MEIWGGDQNIIEGDPFAVGAENQTCVVVESGEGGVELELEESFERQGSDGVDVAPDGVGRDEPAQEGGVAWAKWAKWAKPLKEREVMMESEQRDWAGGVIMDKKATRSSKMEMVIGFAILGEVGGD